MNDDADQAMFFHDELDLALPQSGRVVVQDMKQGVVLRRGHRYFQHLADKVRHHRAATAPLRIEVRDVRHRHVVFKIEQVIPELVAIEHSRSKTRRAKLLAIRIDLGRALDKTFPVPEQVSVMIQIVDDNLETAIPNRLQECRGHVVPLLRDDLEGCLDPKGIVDVHQLAAKIHPARCFHVVRDQRTTGSALRPEPDERNLLQVLRPHGQEQHLLQNIVHRPVDRPVREWNLFPAPEAYFLEMLSNRYR